MANPTLLASTLARLDARSVEIERLLRGTFPAGLLGDSAKLALLEEKIQVVGAKLDLTIEYANNREVTLESVQASLQTLKNERVLISIWLAMWFLDATFRQGLKDRDDRLAVLITRTNTLIKYMLTQTPTPASRSNLPSAISDPQGLTLAELDKLQADEDLKTLAIIGVFVGLGYVGYRKGLWK